MPLYEYRCNDCGKVFEKMVRWSEADRIPACPHCSSQDTKKKISTIASIGAENSQGGASSSSCGSSGGFR